MPPLSQLGTVLSLLKEHPVSLFEHLGVVR